MFTIQKCCDLIGLTGNDSVDCAKRLKKHLDDLVENHFDDLKQMVTPKDVPQPLNDLRKDIAFYLVDVAASDFIVKSLQGKACGPNIQHENFCADLRLVLSDQGNFNYAGDYRRYCGLPIQDRDKGFEEYLKCKTKVFHATHINTRASKLPPCQAMARVRE